MIPELGQLCLSIACCLAAAQALYALSGVWLSNTAWTAVARPVAVSQSLFTLAAFVLLAASFVANDFSVLYVASHSNSELPLMYRIAATWGGHEGSMLLWVLILGIWTLFAVATGERLDRDMATRLLGILGLLSFGLLLFIVLASNPFERLLPAALDGRDLNPLLQDPAMAIHPPMLYVGYVGFAVPFAAAVAGLMAGQVDDAWAEWVRPWATIAWSFLTAGIALGSWWAYYELGWGGWWFWDPVENASFMPWLLGTALIHSLAVTARRGLFRRLSVLLAIGTFGLSLLGTFLVRSGVLVSVHAFASDPERGLFILALLGAVVGGALLLYAWRGKTLEDSGSFEPLSRESMLLANCILMSVATALVLLGTVYPLALDALDLSKISVGAPYFEATFIVPTLPVLLLVGVGMHAGWRQAAVSPLARRVRWPGMAALVLAVALPWVAYGRNGALILSSLVRPWAWIRGKAGRLNASEAGMCIAHLGLGVCVMGITVVSSFGLARDDRVTAGSAVELAGYSFVMRGFETRDGVNYQADQAMVDVFREGSLLAQLYPERRLYNSSEMPMTEAGIDAGLTRDLFVALGEDLGDGSWSVRLQYKPLIRWIWFGAAIMALGGLVANRGRLRRRRSAVQPAADLPARASETTA